MADVCATGLYGIINIGFLEKFGNGSSSPLMLLAPQHCEQGTNGCDILSKDIRTCQSMGVKVMLSLGSYYKSTLYSVDQARYTLLFFFFNHIRKMVMMRIMKFSLNYSFYVSF